MTTGPDDTLSLEGVASDSEGGQPLGFTWCATYVASSRATGEV